MRRKEERKRRRLYRRFVYRVDVVERRPRVKRMNWKFVSYKIIRLFYMTFTPAQYYRIGAHAARLEGSYESNLILFIEGRAMPFLYRIHISYDIFELMEFVSAGILAVNGEVCTNFHVPLGMGSFMVMIAPRLRLWDEIYEKFLDYGFTGKRGAPGPEVQATLLKHPDIIARWRWYNLVYAKFYRLEFGGRHLLRTRLRSRLGANAKQRRAFRNTTPSMRHGIKRRPGSRWKRL